MNSDWSTRSLIAAMATSLMIGVSSASAQTATALIEQGNTFTVNGTSTAVGNFSGFNVNGLGGYLLLVSEGVNSGDDDVEFHVGTATPGAPSVLVSEGTIGSLNINDFVNPGDIATDGTVAYRGQDADGIDAIFRNTTAVAVEGDNIPNGGVLGTYRTPARPQLSDDGSVLTFQSSTLPTPASGSVSGNAVFTDDGSTSLYQFVFGVPGSSTTFNGRTLDQVDLDHEASPDGTRFINVVGLQGLPSTEDNIIILAENTPGGVVLSTANSNGSIIQEGIAIPSAAGIDGALWDNFDHFGIADDGTFLIAGDLDPAGGGSLDYVAINGNLELVTGDALSDGSVVDGAVGLAELSNAGDWAATWAVDTDPLNDGGVVEALIVNGEVVLKVGDLVEFNDELIPLTDLSTSTNNLGIATNNDGTIEVFFTGSTAAGDGFFQITVIPEPTSLALLGLGGLATLARRRRA